MKLTLETMIPTPSGPKRLGDMTAADLEKASAVHRARADRHAEEAALLDRVLDGTATTEDEQQAAKIVREELTRETRLRRMARRRGYLLVKSRRRDRGAYDYGKYVLVEDTKGNRVGRYGGQAAVSAFARGDGMTLDDIEIILLRAHEQLPNNHP
jgi:hypothetical protein